jgi:hypothetical protein
MKNYVSRFLVLIVIAMTVSFSASSQIYVKTRPTHPPVERTAKPGPTYVWIGDEWQGKDGGYTYTGGHWQKPPHRGYTWVTGHWAGHGKDGEKWVAGYWRKPKR